MRPAVVILGFVLGSAAAITFALAGTMIVFVVSALGVSAARERAPAVADQRRRCSRCSRSRRAAASTASSRRRGWRRGAWLALCVVLAAVAAYHAWPRA